MKANIIFSIVLLFLGNALLAQSWQTVGSPGFSSSQAITFTSISINASGVPYVAYVNGGNIYSDGGKSGKVTVMKFDGTNWVVVGTEGFTGVASDAVIKIAPNGTPYVMYSDFGEVTDPSFSVLDYRPTVMKFDGTNWVTVGTARFSAGKSRYPSFAIDNNNTPWVLYLDATVSEKATVKKFNGTSWVTVGTEGFSTTASHYTSIAIDQSGTPFVAYAEWGNGYKLTVKKFVGASWVTVGTESFSTNGTTGNVIAIDHSGAPYVVFQDGSTNKATVMKFDGTQWGLLGGSVPSDDTVNNPTMAIDSENRIYVAYHISFSQSCIGGVAVKVFDNNAWQNVAGTGCIAAGSAQYPFIDLDANGVPYIAYVDNSTGISQKATASKFVKGSQTITFNSIADRLMTDALQFTLSATSTSGLTVSYSSDNTDVATVSGNTVTILKDGEVTITASQTGNVAYNAATNAEQTFTISKASQTITFNPLPAKNVGDGSFNLGATTTSDLDITYSSSNTDVATIVGSAVTIVGTGTATITASQAGNTKYNAATSVEQDLTVHPPKENQTITFEALPAKTFGDASFNLTASATSGLPVSFTSSDPTIASVSGNTLTILKAGTVNITASQSGNATTNAGAAVVQSLTINKANQTIMFDPFQAASTIVLSATASSGLPVSFSSSNTTVATISGNTVTVIATGSSTITASQAGNANYNAAADVSQLLEAVVTGIEPSALSFSLYPNPVSEYLVINTANSRSDITIYQADGKVLDNLSFSSQEIKLNVSNYSPGLYQVKVTCENSVSTLRFIKN